MSAALGVPLYMLPITPERVLAAVAGSTPEQLIREVTMDQLYDLLLVNGTVVTGQGVHHADVGVKGEAVAALGHRPPDVTTRRRSWMSVGS